MKYITGQVLLVQLVKMKFSPLELEPPHSIQTFDPPESLIFLLKLLFLLENELLYTLLNDIIHE